MFNQDPEVIWIRTIRGYSSIRHGSDRNSHSCYATVFLWLRQSKCRPHANYRKNLRLGVTWRARPKSPNSICTPRQKYASYVLKFQRRTVSKNYESRRIIDAPWFVIFCCKRVKNKFDNFCWIGCEKACPALAIVSSLSKTRVLVSNWFRYSLLAFRGLKVYIRVGYSSSQNSHK